MTKKTSNISRRSAGQDFPLSRRGRYLSSAEHHTASQLQQPEDAAESFMDTSASAGHGPATCCPSRQETISAALQRRAHARHRISTQYIHLNKKEDRSADQQPSEIGRTIR